MRRARHVVEWLIGDLKRIYQRKMAAR